LKLKTASWSRAWGVTAPIVVERAIDTNAGRTRVAAGMNPLATRIR
jgi:hypothetical protein